MAGGDCATEHNCFPNGIGNGAAGKNAGRGYQSLGSVAAKNGYQILSIVAASSMDCCAAGGDVNGISESLWGPAHASHSPDYS